VYESNGRVGKKRNHTFRWRLLPSASTLQHYVKASIVKIYRQNFGKGGGTRRNSRFNRERETSGWGPVVDVTQETYISATSSALEVTSYGLQATCSWHCTATRFIGLYVNDVRLQPKLAWADEYKNPPIIFTKFRPVEVFFPHVGEAEEQTQRS